ncbi:hypothetical protein CR513_43372, partial [Mucuna pruriens]
MQSVGSRNIPSQTILSPKGGVSVVTLRSVRAIARTETDQCRARTVPLPFPARTVPTRKSETDEDLLKTFQRVEINIPLLDAIKQIPKYAKFLKELCMHKRKKLKGGVKTGGVVLALIKHEDVTARSQYVLPKKCQDLGIFSVPCTIGNCAFADAMLDVRASINVMSSLIYQSLNIRDLEPTRMIIQLANRNVMQPLGILEDILVQVNELIFSTDFYVLDMEDESSGIPPDSKTTIFYDCKDKD